MNFAVFQSNLVLEFGNRTDLGSYTDGWINTAYTDFCSRTEFWGLKFPQAFTFPELDVPATPVNTVAGTAYIAAPSDCLFIHSVWDGTNDRKLTRIPSVRKYVEKTGRATTASRGKPTEWIRFANDSGVSRIYLYPTPDAVYALTAYYRKRPALLTGTGTTEIGAEWDEPILKLAVIQSLMRLHDYEKAAIEKKEWLDMMAGKLGFYKKEEKDGSHQFSVDTAYKSYGY